MTMTNKIHRNHLASLVAAAASADRRNDAAARDRACFEATVTYAYCRPRTFRSRMARLLATS